MPAYHVELAAAAKRDLSHLLPSVARRVVVRLAALAEDPRPMGSTKLSGLDAYRVRVGDHRIVYEIDDERRRVHVDRIAHRREVYRRLR